jgi:hypothetical protein
MPIDIRMMARCRDKIDVSKPRRGGGKGDGDMLLTSSTSRF